MNTHNFYVLRWKECMQMDVVFLFREIYSDRIDQVRESILDFDVACRCEWERLISLVA